MADPIAFDEANLKLVGPDGDPNIRPLPVHRGVDGRIVSCWQLSGDDLRRIAATGEVWLSVWSGATAPPVLVSGRKEDVL